MLHKHRFSLLFLFVLLAVCLVVAAACDGDTHVHSYGTEWHFDATNHWLQCSCKNKKDEAAHTPSSWIVDTPATASQEGSKHKECTVCAYVLETAKIDKLTSSDSPRTADFYAINDFHGKVDRMSTVAGYLTQQRNANANTVLINSGDMFQGSMESNSNYGALLSDCMDDVGFDAFTFGNHEFDWGLDNLIALAKQSGVPFLGANIYHWNAATKQWGTFADELAQEYTVKTLDNGLKIGIIGVIGKDQITSISSQLVQTIGFKDPAEVIPALSAKLRNQLACDIVIVSAHAGPETFLENTAWDITEYCDAVFCAHTHRTEQYTRNGVPFIQGGSYGGNVSRVRLEVSETGAVTCKTSENIPYSTNWPNKLSVGEMIDNSNESIREEASRVLANLDGYLSSRTFPNLVCNAIADYANQNYPELPIALAMVNVARNDVDYSVTYSELYEAIPFDNVIYIAKVSGSDILKEAYYGNYVWRVSEEPIKNSNTDYYYIAVIDYLLFHQNTYRDYNYFPSAFTSGFDPIPLENSNYDAGKFNYRVLTRDWMLAQAEEIQVAKYCSSNNFIDVNLLEVSVDLSGNTPQPARPQHVGTESDPYTVADAAILAQGITDADGAMLGYLKATVCNVSNPIFSNYNGAVRNVYVRDEDGNMLMLYWINKYPDGVSGNWNQNDFELHVGDEVLILGKFIMYRDTVEVTQGYCVSINGEYTA